MEANQEIRELFALVLSIKSNGEKTFKIKKEGFNPPISIVQELLLWAQNVLLETYINSLITKKLDESQHSGIIIPQVISPTNDEKGKIHA